MTTRNVLRRARSSEGQTASVRATIFNINRAEADTSRQPVLSEEFLSLAGTVGATVVIPPPYATERLFQLIEQSNMLRQCIDAYVTNTVLAGWEIEPKVRGKDVRAAERAELDSFLDNANTEQDLKTVMEEVIRDRESCGYGFLEVIQSVSGEISLLRSAPALYTRLCAKDPKEQLVQYSISRGRRVSTVQEYRKFRRFVQIYGGRQTWFREFGDPRRMDYTNGAFEGEPGYNPANQATSIIHFRNPSNEVYGVPRWINQLPSIIGSREAEEVNMRYFQDNTVPPMLLLVGNGRLTTQSYRELTRALNQDDLGKKRQNKIMLLEAVGEGDSMDGRNSAIELKVEKLTDARQSDGLFSAYDAANMAKVRSSFRLPPITVGMSQDVNFATASTSAFVAESQVFSPERDKIDQVLNKLLINGPHGLKLISCKLVSRTPSITSPEMLIKTLTALNVIGALTPRAAQVAANKVLQIEIPEYPRRGEADYEEWMDRPISMSVKQGASPDGGEATHDEQNQKTDAIKEVEGEGDVGADVPKHGEE